MRKEEGTFHPEMKCMKNSNHRVTCPYLVIVEHPACLLPADTPQEAGSDIPPSTHIGLTANLPGKPREELLSYRTTPFWPPTWPFIYKYKSITKDYQSPKGNQ